MPTGAELARREGRPYEPASALLAPIHAVHAEPELAKTASRLSRSPLARRSERK